MSESLPQDFPTTGLHTAFLQEDYNGFGFQVIGNARPGYLAVARLPADCPGDLASKLQDKTGSMSVELADFVGNYFLVLHYTEWDLIPKIFSASCDLGCVHISSNTLHLQPRPKFTGQEFSFEEAERICIKQFRKVVSLFATDPWKRGFELLGSPKPMRQFHNWRTEEGKLFCAELCAKIGKPHADTSVEVMHALPPWFETPEVDRECKEAGVLHYAGWSRRTPVAEPKEFDTKILSKRQKSESNDECIVCFERNADTLVLPCEHVVVCHTCSLTLARSPFASQCIWCQQPITEVLMDEHSEESSNEVMFISDEH